MNDSVTYCTHCHFQLPMCYVTPIDEKEKAYFCANCGFSSNTMMISGSQYVLNAVATMPQLYIDALYLDESGKYWHPTTVNMPEKGMVFLSGTSLEDCEWCAMKVTKITPEEKDKFKKPGTNEYFQFKMDKTTLKNFGKTGFMDCLEYIGAIEMNPEFEA